MIRTLRPVFGRSKLALASGSEQGRDGEGVEQEELIANFERAAGEIQPIVEGPVANI
jgi:hypothetical protein